MVYTTRCLTASCPTTSFLVNIQINAKEKAINSAIVVIDSDATMTALSNSSDPFRSLRISELLEQILSANILRFHRFHFRFTIVIKIGRIGRT